MVADAAADLNIVSIIRQDRSNELIRDDLSAARHMYMSVLFPLAVFEVQQISELQCSNDKETANHQV